jgi:hypothetical protein
MFKSIGRGSPMGADTRIDGAIRQSVRTSQAVAEIDARQSTQIATLEGEIAALKAAPPPAPPVHTTVIVREEADLSPLNVQLAQVDEALQNVQIAYDKLVDFATKAVISLEIADKSLAAQIPSLDGLLQTSAEQAGQIRLLKYAVAFLLVLVGISYVL